MSMRYIQQMPFRKAITPRFICFKEGDAPDAGTATGTEKEIDELEVASTQGKDLTLVIKEQMGGKTGDDSNPPPPPNEEELKKQKEIEAQRLAAANQDFMAPFKHLQEKYKIEIPKDVTQENAMEVLVDTVLKNADITPFLDPRVAKIHEAVTSGTAFEEAVKEFVPVGGLQGEEKVKAYYKEKYGLKEEQLPDYMKDINLKKEELEADAYFKQKDERQRQLSEVENRKKAQEEYQRAEQTREQGITTSLANFKKKNEIWGVKLTDQDKTKFEKTLRDWVTPGKDGEPAPIVALLNNDDFLANVVFIASQPGRVKDLLDTEKEELRKFYQTRLGLEPDVQQSGRGGDTNPADPDISLLRRPAVD